MSEFKRENSIPRSLCKSGVTSEEGFDFWLIDVARYFEAGATKAVALNLSLSFLSLLNDREPASYREEDVSYLLHFGSYSLPHSCLFDH